MLVDKVLRSAKNVTIYADLLSGSPSHKTPLNLSNIQNYFPYSLPLGTNELREKIGNLKGVDPSGVAIGNGAKSLISSIIQILDKNNIKTKKPYYPPIKSVTKYIKKYFDTYHEDDLESIKESIVIITTPNNPDSRITSPKVLNQLSEQGNQVIIDATYDFLQEVPLNISDEMIYINSFSKSFSIPGLRLGYVIAKPSLISKLEDFVRSMFNGPNILSQGLVLDAIREMPQEYFSEVRKLYQSRMSALTQKLTSAGIGYVNPEIPYFCWADLPQEFAFDLVEKGILVWPGGDFGDESKIRLCVGSAGISDIEYFVDNIYK